MNIHNENIDISGKKETEPNRNPAWAYGFSRLERTPDKRGSVVRVLRPTTLAMRNI